MSLPRNCPTSEPKKGAARRLLMLETSASRPAIEKLVPKVGLEPTRDILPPVFETGASTIPPLRPGNFSIARLRLSPVAL